MTEPYAGTWKDGHTFNITSLCIIYFRMKWQDRVKINSKPVKEARIREHKTNGQTPRNVMHYQ